MRCRSTLPEPAANAVAASWGENPKRDQRDGLALAY